MRFPKLARSVGITLLEVAAAIGVLAILLSLGFSTYKGVRVATRAAVAQTNLRQLGVYLELYFRRYGTYPPQGSDLAAALRPLGATDAILSNPLMEESRPGETVTALYRAPTIAELDSPNHYITAMVSENGHTAVVLKTGNIVERRDDLSFDPSDLGSVLAALTGTPPSQAAGSATPPGWFGSAPTGTNAPTSYASEEPPSPPPQPPTPEPEPQPQPQPGNAISGEININPNNKSDYEFELRKPDGSTITRDHLLASGGELDYSGPATYIRVRPKGNGNQNGLTLDGKPYPIQNGTQYIIETLPPGGTMTVHLYNDSPPGKGKAMGEWWIAITAKGARITAN